MVDLSGALILYQVISFAIFVVLIKYVGGYILNKGKPFKWIPSTIAAALIFVAQWLIGAVLMGLGTLIFG